jgi:hypothetical protein
MDYKERKEKSTKYVDSKGQKLTLAQSQFPYTVYTLVKEMTNLGGDLIWKYESPVVLKFHNSV